MQTSPVDKKIMFNLLPFSLQDELRQVSNHRFPLTRNDCMRHVRHDTDLNCFNNVLGNWVSGLPKCGKVKFVCLFVCFHQYYSLLGHFSSLTTTASWCFPSKGKNSLKHTSNPPELTFSNHKYIASFGLVLRVYLTETNTRGLEAKLCKKMLDIWKTIDWKINKLLEI